MIPVRLAPVAFGLVMSGLMIFLVTGIATVRHASPVDGFGSRWRASWPVGFPVVLVVAPLAHRLAQRLVVA